MESTIFEPNHPQLVRVELPLGRLPEAWDGLTIAQLSDFHYDPRFSEVPLRKAIPIVNNLKPDLIVLTGDFVTVPLIDGPSRAKNAAHAAEPCAKLLSELKAPLGVFAVLGNHDVASEASRVVSALQGHGIQVLRNRSLPLERDAKRVWLSGIDNVLEGAPDLEITLQPVPHEEPVILLVHEPDFADSVARHPVDLQLSGHSHGGQIRLPFLGAVFLPELGRKFPRGLYKLGPLTLYTNVGLGTIRIPVRWNCPPEITLFTLRSRPDMLQGSAIGRKNSQS